MANEYMKRCSTLLIIREMQIKITVRYFFTPVRMTVNNQVLVSMWRKGTRGYCWWEYRLTQRYTGPSEVKNGIAL